MRPPTARQIEVLAFVSETIAVKGYAPTLREVCVRLGATATKAAVDHLRALARRGLVTWTPKRHRGLRLTATGRRVLAEQGRAALGGEVTVTRDGAPVALFWPVTPAEDRVRDAEARAA